MTEVKNIYTITCVSLTDGDKHDLRHFLDLNYLRMPLAERGHTNHQRENVRAPHLTKRMENHIQA